jgi:hypothetical protein
LNLTPVWRRRLGRSAEFLSAPTGHIEEAYVPTFNALNVFRVPDKAFRRQRHALRRPALFGDRLVSRR